jgi:hypothetical protein
MTKIGRNQVMLIPTCGPVVDRETGASSCSGWQVASGLRPDVRLLRVHDLRRRSGASTMRAAPALPGTDQEPLTDFMLCGHLDAMHERSQPRDEEARNR